MRLRAGASNAPMLAALGIDVGRLFALVLACGAMLAGFAGALAAPLVSVDTGMGGTVLILAFVVIVLGGTGSVRGAFAGALLVGLTDTLGRDLLAGGLQAGDEPVRRAPGGPGARFDVDLPADGPRARAASAGPAAGARPRVIPRRRPGLRTALAVLLLVALALAPLAAHALGNPYLLSLATRATILAIGAVSLQFAVGFAGLPSLGHAAFLGIGAYALGILGANGLDEAAISIPVALAAAALFAVATGAVALRASGVAFLMITLAFAQMAFFVASSLSAYGGDNGMALDQAPAAVRRGGARQSGRAARGRRGAAARDDPALAARSGSRASAACCARRGRTRCASPRSASTCAASRLVAYALSGMGGALAGWLLAANAGFISPAVLDWRVSAELLVMVILGGTASPLHAALGAGGLVLTRGIPRRLHRASRPRPRPAAHPRRAAHAPARRLRMTLLQHPRAAQILRRPRRHGRCRSRHRAPARRMR